jgi:acetyl-CoA acetyltransferase
MAKNTVERKCAVTGIGQSEVGRRLGIEPLTLTMDACYKAIEDAGLQISDIDGLSSYPGPGSGGSGFNGANVYEVIDAMRLQPNWYDSGMETPGQLGSVMKAVMAINAGFATHVLCYRSVWEGTAQGTGGRKLQATQNPYAEGLAGWTTPYGSISAANWIALYAQAHFDRFGTTSEQLGQIAVNARRNAALNPKAIYTDPMTLDDYLSSRMITTPLRLFDCDAPCDGATAFIISRRDAAKDTASTPITIEAMGSALHDRSAWDQLTDLTRMVGADAAAQMWSRTDLTPQDVDIAELYDGFSILTLLWLEAMQLVPFGEAGSFLEGGQNIARDGILPLNTHGGQLSAGRLHGYGFFHEAVVQLRGDGGARQVTAKTPKVAAVAAGGGNTCGCFLLSTRD